MKPSTHSPRIAMLEQLELLASASAQRKYEQEVPHVPVHVELIDGFVTDTYHPKSHEFIAAFTEEELKDIAWLFGLLCTASERLKGAPVYSVSGLQKLPEWQSVMSLSKRLNEDFQKRA